MPTSIVKKVADKNEAIEAVAAHAEIHVEGDNWVGALQNAAVHVGIKASPKYAFQCDAKSPEHQRVFQCTVSLSGRVATGTGSSKQAAKRAAAKAWIEA